MGFDIVSFVTVMHMLTEPWDHGRLGLPALWPGQVISSLWVEAAAIHRNIALGLAEAVANSIDPDLCSRDDDAPEISQSTLSPPPAGTSPGCERCYGTPPLLLLPSPPLLPGLMALLPSRRAPAVILLSYKITARLGLFLGISQPMKALIIMLVLLVRPLMQLPLQRGLIQAHARLPGRQL